jgi:hypothetical protein
VGHHFGIVLRVDSTREIDCVQTSPATRPIGRQRRESSMLRRVVAFFVPLILLALLGSTPAQATDLARTGAGPAPTRPALDGPCSTQYHYAGMFTAQTSVIEHLQTSQCGPSGSGYFGWAGVDGQISTPSTNPPIDVNQDHQAGWIGVVFSNGGWVQLGWYRGVIGCGSNRVQYTGTGYHLYVESALSPPVAPACTGYSVHDYSPLSLGGAVTYLISYSAGCWHIFYNYDHEVPQVCGPASSGSVEVDNELYNLSGTAQMPRSDFGATDPNTNQALRLLGAGGWVPWTSTISHGTDVYDWRGLSTNNKTVLSAYSLLWHVQTYGAAG